MGRDFAKKGRQSRDARDAPAYHWSWLLAGTLIGFIVSAIAYFKLFPSLNVTVAELEEKITPKTASPAVVVETKPERSATFDFYNLLPEQEVKVPAVEEQATLATIEPKLVPTPTPTATLNAPPAASSPPAAHTAEPLTYRLQLASFRNYKEADSLKAQMALNGVEVEIEAVTVGPNDTWFRVQTLPYPNRDSAESARQQLQAQSIQSMILEEQG